MKRHPELSIAPQAFNLSGEQGNDPFRLEREKWQAEERQRQAREFEAKYQRKFEECPGFVACDAPSGPDCVGKVVVDPGKASEAREWLKKRFKVDEDLTLSPDTGLCFRVMPRAQKASTQRTYARKFTFVKPHQYELTFEDSK